MVGGHGSGRAVAAGGLAGWEAARVLAWSEQKLGGRLRLAEIAAIARLSSSHFSRAFKTSFEHTAYAYLMRMRVERAKRLMLDEAMPLAEIALDCGLSDQAHLSRMFRQITGERPSAWRRRHRQPE